MARAPRNNRPGTLHHVMNQGVDRNNVFLGDPDRHTIERLFGQLHDEHGVSILAYCLMGNHYHFVGRAGDDGISAGMQQLSSSYTRIVNERVGRVGPLFRGRFTSVAIDSDDQLLTTVAYVHRNPVDLVPAAALASYRWSSYGAYLARRTAPPWLDTDLVSAMMSPEQHREMVEGGLGEPTGTCVAPDLLDEAVARVVPDESGCRRTVALVASAGAGACGTQELMRRFGLPTPAAARMALSRARGRCERSADLAVMVAVVESAIAASGVTRGV
jgi:REP element-mobilizing transposase RayT